MTKTALQERHDTGEATILYMAFELSNKEWKLGFGIGGNYRIRSMPHNPKPPKQINPHNPKPPKQIKPKFQTL